MYPQPNNSAIVRTLFLTTPKTVRPAKQSILCTKYVRNNLPIKWTCLVNPSAPCVLYIDRRFATLQRTPFIYLINKYITLYDI